MILEENLQYQRPVDRAEDLPAEWNILLKWVGEDKTVLEAGCHTGDFSKWLKGARSKVTGIELNEKALSKAIPYLHEAIKGDIESEEVWEKLTGKRYDVVLFVHVLEHLQNPWQVLARAKGILSNHGELIIVLPNINNADSRLQILYGNFEYHDTGVMDRTHLRFFNYHTALRMIRECGFTVMEYESSWQVNPMREFVDHLPVIYRLKFLFGKKPPKFPRFSRNLTDVVMMFRCRVSNNHPSGKK